MIIIINTSMIRLLFHFIDMNVNRYLSIPIGYSSLSEFSTLSLVCISNYRLSDQTIHLIMSFFVFAFVCRICVYTFRTHMWLRDDMLIEIKINTNLKFINIFLGRGSLCLFVFFFACYFKWDACWAFTIDDFRLFNSTTNE